MKRTSLLSSAPAPWSPVFWHCFLAAELHDLRQFFWWERMIKHLVGLWYKKWG